MATTYRIALPVDGPALASFIGLRVAAEGIAVDKERLTRALERSLVGRRAGITWLVERDAEPVGYGVLQVDATCAAPRTAYITALYLIPAYRRRGFGTFLRQLMETVGRQQGCRVVHLGTQHEDKHAQHLTIGRGVPARSSHIARLVAV